LFTDREKNFDSNENFIRAGASFVDGELAIPANRIVGSTNSGNIGLDIVAYDPSSFLTDGTYTLEKATFDTEWVVEEEITTFYAMAELESEFNGVPMFGNVGFQYQDVDQSSTANLQGGGERQQTLGASESYFLPSANLSFEVSPDTFLRFAAAQTVTRPRLDNLAANQTVSINNQVCADTDGDFVPDSLVGFTIPTNACFNISGGNPQLEPYQSTSFDVSYEKYFGPTTALSVAVFHKELSDWVETATRTTDITEQLNSIGIPALDAFVAANPEVATAVTSFPENISDGSITGIEATLRMSLDDYLPQQFEGFGFNASYTYADSSLSGALSGDDIRIPGYSDNVWSGDIYYENHGWRSRISARHRSGFLSEVPQFDGSLTGAEAQDETIVDLQIGYEWEEGSLEGFSVNFEVFNLTNEPFVTEAETIDPSVVFPSRHEDYGTTYNITVSKTF
jgi:iron complex outermembrane receptor protein